MKCAVIDCGEPAAVAVFRRDDPVLTLPCCAEHAGHLVGFEGDRVQVRELTRSSRTRSSRPTPNARQ